MVRAIFEPPLNPRESMASAKIAIQAKLGANTKNAPPMTTIVVLTLLDLKVRGFLIHRHTLKLEGIRLANSTPSPNNPT
ncbi:hypothetical protein L6494_04435 [Nostoc sp. UHCC 0870]|uniref:hypothetical protein n=1 Tax=Nostoc sp. UHCC 0870 TaxID=2914041 RepID=UPI001EDDF712|nr:hypothetical protein [Nostoc sp. UHCC 0870]UKO98984.1 hypothetical protein L6494_04435 [Nostoc sp. UHCC 0870]